MPEFRMLASEFGENCDYDPTSEQAQEDFKLARAGRWPRELLPANGQMRGLGELYYYMRETGVDVSWLLEAVKDGAIAW